MFGGSALLRHIAKVTRVQQLNGTNRSAYLLRPVTDAMLQKMKCFAECYRWYAREHRSYQTTWVDQVRKDLEDPSRVDAGVSLARLPAEAAYDGGPTTLLTLGTWNIHGIRKKQQDLWCFLDKRERQPGGLQGWGGREDGCTRFFSVVPAKR